MTKFFVAVLSLALAYFVFLKRTEPPKEVQVEEVQAQFTETQQPRVQQTTIEGKISVGSATTNIETPASAFAETAVLEAEPQENVDQTVIANEKKLAEAKTGPEVFELLQKLRIRMKKLSEISAVANTQNYAKFFGNFEGPVVNRRNESVYSLKLEIKQNSDPQAAYISGSFDIDKAKDGKVKGYFNGDFGMQLVGRDGLVISDATEINNFQIYKLDNGMIAGNYYEKRKASYRVYKFILKRK